jgi:hypothetical protein
MRLTNFDALKIRDPEIRRTVKGRVASSSQYSEVEIFQNANP